MNYTKSEQKLRDKIRDACYYNGAGMMSATYADAVMEIPQVKAAPEMYEALKQIAEMKVLPVSYIEVARNIVAKAEGGKK